MSPKHSDHLIEEAQATLEFTLTEEERKDLQVIYGEINRQILWDSAIGEGFTSLLGMGEDLLNGGEARTKHGSAWHTVTSEETRLFREEDPKSMSRKHLLTLLLAKKLLGGLRTRVNQSIEDIRILLPEEEEHLMDVATQPDQPAAKDVVAEIAISPEGKCCRGELHIKIEVRWKREDGNLIKETYCKGCRQVIQRLVNSVKESTRAKCQHPGAEWVEGAEGQEAICCNPACRAPIEDPDTYHWTESGLEPVDDDPNQDEAITLCSDYSS